MKYVKESLQQFDNYKFFKVFEETDEKKEKTQLQDKEAEGLKVIDKIKSNFETFKKEAKGEIIKYKEFWEENKKTKEAFGEGDIYKMYNDDYVIGVLELPVETLSDGSIDGGLGAIENEDEDEIIEGKEIGDNMNSEMSEAEEDENDLDLDLDAPDKGTSIENDKQGGLSTDNQNKPAEIPNNGEENDLNSIPPENNTSTETDINTEESSNLNEPQIYFVVYDNNGDEREEIFRTGSSNVVKAFKEFYNDTFKGAMKNIIIQYKNKKEQQKIEAEKSEKEQVNKEKTTKLNKFLGENKRYKNLSKLNENELTKSGHRPLYQIAQEIRGDWERVNYAAEPYLEAMLTLDDISDNYYMDSAYMIVAYFLSNSSSWKGPLAKKIKNELNNILRNKHKFESYNNKKYTTRNINEQVDNNEEEVYELWLTVNGRIKEEIKGTLEDLRERFSAAIDRVSNTDPKDINQLINFINKASQIKFKGKKDIKYKLKEINESYNGDDEPFKVHGFYTVSNTGGYEVQISDDGNSARVRDAFSYGTVDPKISEWFEIEWVENEDDEDDLSPVIDPDGYNIPLNMVMRVNESYQDNRNWYENPKNRHREPGQVWDEKRNEWINKVNESTKDEFPNIQDDILLGEFEKYENNVMNYLEDNDDIDFEVATKLIYYIKEYYSEILYNCYDRECTPEEAVEELLTDEDTLRAIEMASNNAELLLHDEETKVGDKIKVEGKKPGFFVSAKITGIKGDMISYETIDGDSGNLRKDSEKLSLKS
jgi:hypothetical protein